MMSSAITGCNKNSQAPDQSQAGPALPVSIVQVQPVSVPISAEAVAQTEGAKEVEIRPRVGGILLKRLYEEGTRVKADQPMFQIDPIPYQYARIRQKPSWRSRGRASYRPNVRSTVYANCSPHKPSASENMTTQDPTCITRAALQAAKFACATRNAISPIRW